MEVAKSASATMRTRSAGDARERGVHGLHADSEGTCPGMRRSAAGAVRRRLAPKRLTPSGNVSMTITSATAVAHPRTCAAVRGAAAKMQRAARAVLEDQAPGRRQGRRFVWAGDDPLVGTGKTDADA